MFVEFIGGLVVGGVIGFILGAMLIVALVQTALEKMGEDI